LKKVAAAIVLLGGCIGSRTAAAQYNHLAVLPNWATDEWIPTPREYREADQAVKREVATSADRLSVLRRYEKKANDGRAALDPLLQFEWATVWLLTRNMDGGGGLHRYEVENSLTRIPFPGNIAYARVCFLIHDWGAGDRRGDPTAERMVAAFPKDASVIYTAAKVYGTYGSKLETQRYLELSNDLIRLNPGKTGGYSLVGFYYYDRWDRLHDKAALPMALDYNTKALEKGPYNEQDRVRLVAMIGKLQRASR
jgi:hypothetical protein